MRVVEHPFSEFLRQPNEVVAELADHDVGLDDALEDVFPWSTFLPKRDRATFVDELVRTLVAASAIDNFAPVAQLLREWRATAAIHADPRLARRLRRATGARGDQVQMPEV